MEVKEAGPTIFKGVVLPYNLGSKESGQRWAEPFFKQKRGAKANRPRLVSALVHFQVKALVGSPMKILGAGFSWGRESSIDSKRNPYTLAQL